MWSEDIILSDGFGVDDLRAYNDVLPLPYTLVTLEQKTTCAACDLSFLTGVTGLWVMGLTDATLTLPPRLVHLSVDDGSRQVTVSGTENLTSLSVSSEDSRTTPCPKLEKLCLSCGETLSDKTLPCSIADIPTLSKIHVMKDAIDPDFRFPTQLTSLYLKVFNGPVNVALVTSLTRLQFLNFNVDEGQDHPFDLSGLTMLTWLRSSDTPISGLPSSLVECKVRLLSDTDLSSFNNLTMLDISLHSKIRVTFPTGLKKLYVSSGQPFQSNISDVALESYELKGWPRQITQEDLEKLPKTLKHIDGFFEPESLKEHLHEMFPLYETHKDGN